MSRMWKVLVLLVLLVGVLGGLYGYGVSQPTSAVGGWMTRLKGHPNVSYRTSPVVRQDLLATISASGTLEPEEVYDVGAQVQTATKISSFGPDPNNSQKTVDFGTVVKKDDLLAVLDPTLYEARVKQAEANLERAKAGSKQMDAKLVQAQREWERDKKLTPGTVISPSDLDVAEANYLVAKANVADAKAAIGQAESALTEAKINFEYTMVKSPIDGVILVRSVNVGQTVVASFSAPSLFTIAKDLHQMNVWASVNEADIDHILAGQKVRFTVDALPNKVFDGEVLPGQPRLNAASTQNVVTYTVLVRTNNPDLKLKPYLTADLQFEVGNKANALAVPNRALRWLPSIDQVAPDARDDYVARLKRKSGNGKDGRESQTKGIVWVEDNGYVRPVKVRLGLNDGQMTEIVPGDLEEGAPLVIGVDHDGNGASDSSNPFAPKLFSGAKKPGN